MGSNNFTPEALAHLREQLCNAHKQAVTNQDGGGLEAARLALSAVIELLHSIPDFDKVEVLGPLLELSDALDDLARGKRPEMFKVKGGAGRPGDPMNVLYLEAWVAAAMQVLMECFNVREKEAAARIASVVRKSRKSLSDVDGKSVRNWRRKFEDGSFDDFGVQRYRDSVQRLKNQIAGAPRPIDSSIFIEVLALSLSALANRTIKI